MTTTMLKVCEPPCPCYTYKLVPVIILNAMPLFTTITSISMLVFCLLYTPCVAAMAAIRRELGSKWMLFIIAFQCVVAWLCAWFAYLIANAIIA